MQKEAYADTLIYYNLFITIQIWFGHPNPHIPGEGLPAVPDLWWRDGLQDVPGPGSGAGIPQGAAEPAVPLPRAGHPREGVLRRVYPQLLL